MTFFISTKIQDGGEDWKSSKFFRGPKGVVQIICPKLLLSRGPIYLPKFYYSFPGKWHPFPAKFEMVAKIQKIIGWFHIARL